MRRLPTSSCDTPLSGPCGRRGWQNVLCALQTPVADHVRLMYLLPLAYNWPDDASILSSVWLSDARSVAGKNAVTIVSPPPIPCAVEGKRHSQPPPGDG